MVGVNTENFRRRSGGGLNIPQPRVLFMNATGSGISNFAGDPVSWFQEVTVRFGEVPPSFAAAQDIWLELAWCRTMRRNRATRPISRRDYYRRWSFPDDPIVQNVSSGMGGGGQNGPVPGTGIPRRSKWVVTPVMGELAVPGRIELEHYYRRQEITIVTGETAGTPDTAPMFMLRPTFLTNRLAARPISITQWNTLSTVPRYNGYEHGYFAFCFSVKDPNGQHPGDRIRGPMSKILKCVVRTIDNAFPVAYGDDGFAFEVAEGTHLMFQFARGS